MSGNGKADQYRNLIPEKKGHCCDYTCPCGSEAFRTGVWKALEEPAKEVPECCELILMCDSGGNSEDLDTDRNVESKDHVHEVSDGEQGLHW